jgi:serine/threonine protein kinase
MIILLLLSTIKKYKSSQKPDNIGFDTNGVVKLYDFGLARELRSIDRCCPNLVEEDGLYRLTGMTGGRFVFFFSCMFFVPQQQNHA